ncbi:MAG: hypothetical protein IPN90_10965 [Elusimicrobia bacterium]|nr:hypothetical protein [Elusimicrobiota bacterium]
MRNIPLGQQVEMMGVTVWGTDFIPRGRSHSEQEQAMNAVENKIKGVLP